MESVMQNAHGHHLMSPTWILLTVYVFKVKNCQNLVCPGPLYFADDSTKSCTLGTNKLKKFVPVIQ